jgi:hypothetical protein
MHLCLMGLCAKTFCAQLVFCARDFSLAVRAFWRAESLRWVETNFKEMRKVDQCSDEMKTLRRTYLDDMWEEMGWDEKRWDEVRRGEMRWQELTWYEMRWSAEYEVQVWSVKSGVWSVKCEESVCLALHGTRVAHRACSWATSVQQVRTKHAQAWMAHGACNFYRWERKNTYSITLRQLPPRLVRVLLVALLISYWLLSF